MKVETKLTEAIGKTISAVELSHRQCVSAFDDGTFATLGIYYGYEPGDELITEDELDLFCFGDEKLIRAEIVTAHEIDYMRKTEREEEEMRQEERDRKEYRRLKLKFDGYP